MLLNFGAIDAMIADVKLTQARKALSLPIWKLIFEISKSGKRTYKENVVRKLFSGKNKLCRGGKKHSHGPRPNFKFE